MKERFLSFILKPVEYITKKKQIELPHSRLIPTTVKLEVWARDKGQCVLCGSKENLHFDHDLPFSKGGTSLTAKNVKILCAKHNLQKSDKILYFPADISFVDSKDCFSGNCRIAPLPGITVALLTVLT